MLATDVHIVRFRVQGLFGMLPHGMVCTLSLNRKTSAHTLRPLRSPSHLVQGSFATSRAALKEV